MPLTLKEDVMFVVGISCSPRKDGNTDILVNEVLKTARENGCETEFISVVGKNLSGCIACEKCLENNKCSIDDDMQEIHASFIRADAIVFGTPAYFANVSSQAKAVIDRTFSLKFTKQLKNKVAAPVVATYRVGAAQILSLLNFFFSNHRMLVAGGVCGFGYAKGEVREGYGAWTPSALDEARAVGKSVVRLVQRLERGKE
jgi:multimeric flavodoxin WrbA